jgi:chemotaxis protein MotB
MRRFAVLLVVPLLLACATTRPEHLSALSPGADDAMVDSHDTARRAYDRCLDDWEESSFPWQLYLASGTGVLSAGLLGAAVAMAALLPDPAVSAALVGGLGAGSVLSAGTAMFFGVQAPPASERRDAYEKVLGDARSRADAALSERDSVRMAQLARELYENCRTISQARNGQGAGTIIRDLGRYRRDLDAKQAQLRGVAKHREDLEKQNEDLGGRLVTTEQSEREQAERISRLQGQLAQKESENGSLRARTDELERERASLSKREQKLLEEKKKLEAKTSHFADVADKLKAEVESGRIAVRRLRDGVVVELQNKVLFASGQADLEEAGKETLTKVAAAIAGIDDRRVRVEGHTDNVPVGKSNPFADNWNLSAQRALTVARFLQQAGVDPSILSAEARGEFAPVASNDDDGGKARNRRIEIYLVPKATGASDSWKPTTP